MKRAGEAKKAREQRKSERAKSGGSPHAVFRNFFYNIRSVTTPLSWSLEEVKCENVIKARRPKIIVVKKKANNCITVDIVIPGDCRIHNKKLERVEN